MTIIFNDGSTLTCEEIEIDGFTIIADSYREVPTDDIEKIISD